MQNNFSEYEKKELQYAHLNLDFSKIDFAKLRDPLAGYYSSEYFEEILKLIREPRNFYFTCKYILNLEVPPIQLVFLEQLWKHAFPMFIASRGAGKTWCLAMYCLLRLLITQGCKIVITSASFRQAKFVFDYMEQIINGAPVFRDLTATTGIRKGTDMYTLRVGDSVARAIPIGTGEKIRGLRANYIIAEEFSCLDENSLVETSCGLKRISDCYNEDILLVNKDGNYELPKHFIITPKTDVYEIITERGYSFKCSSIHKVLTTRGFKLAKDLTSEDCLVSENRYVFPEEKISYKNLLIDENMAWLMGILTSDKDKRFKKECKESYFINLCKLEFRNWLSEVGLERSTCHTKKIPWTILQSPRSVVIRFLSGLFEGDGSAFLWNCKEKNNKLGVNYCTTSKQLAEELHVVLLKLGYLSNLQPRTCKIGNTISNQWMIRLNGSYAYTLAKELNIPKWDKIISICDEGLLSNKPTINYCPSMNCYVVYNRINGKNKRTGKYKNYEKALEVYNKNNIQHFKVRSVVKLNYQDNLYDLFLPDTNSFYANGFIQHNSIPQQVFEEVISGFAASASSPVENMKRVAQIEKLKAKGLWNNKVAAEMGESYKPNQVILSGTASWDFNHFAKYWKEYKAIINSRGDEDRLHQALGDKWSKELSWTDYCVIRVPLELIPKGMMDEKNIARAKAGTTVGIADNEYSCIFSKDSYGFFPRRLIESCVCKKPITLPEGEVQFVPRITGDGNLKYIMGVDPASEQDNFSIVILEMHRTHKRLVYCWTTNRQKHFRKFKEKKERENYFYGYINQKIRALMRVFPIQYIALDAFGGGTEVMGVLHDLKRLEEGEVPLWPLRKDSEIIWPNAKDYGYDDEFGLHIIEMVAMSKHDYVMEANHGLKQDMENKTLLFPAIDAVSFMEIEEIDEEDRLYDSLQDVYMEILELYEELATISHTTTQTGMDRWETPAVITSGTKRARMRKDRYSALMMANALARRLMKTTTINYDNGALGGFVSEFKGQSQSEGALYNAPAWWAEPSKGALYGIGVSKQAGVSHYDPYERRLY